MGGMVSHLVNGFPEEGGDVLVGGPRHIFSVKCIHLYSGLSKTVLVNMQNKKYSCPGCSFEIQSPAGVEDVLKHAQMHSEAHHKDKTMTEAQFRDMIKDA